MTGAEIVLLIGCVIVIGVGLLIIAAIAVLIWSFKKLAPEEELISRLMLLETKVDNLESQVVQLRTKKAGRASAARKAEDRAQPQSDPRLAGLSPEDKALFTAFGLDPDEEEVTN